VRLSAGRLTLDPDICTVDVWDFERALRAAADAESVEAVLDTYDGDFLGDDQAVWAIALRERLAQLATRKSNRLGVLRVLQSRPGCGPVYANS
jgi:two-component SAPR family response regulator